MSAEAMIFWLLGAAVIIGGLPILAALWLSWRRTRHQRRLGLSNASNASGGKR